MRGPHWAILSRGRGSTYWAQRRPYENYPRPAIFPSTARGARLVGSPWTCWLSKTINRETVCIAKTRPRNSQYQNVRIYLKTTFYCMFKIFTQHGPVKYPRGSLPPGHSGGDSARLPPMWPGFRFPDPGPVSRKSQKQFRASKAIFSWSVSKNGEGYATEILFLLIMCE